MTETQFIDPAKASSALGEAIARLLQASGLEIDIDAFGEIDEIAATLKPLQSQLIDADWARDSGVEELKDQLSDLSEISADVDYLGRTLNKLETSIYSRLSALEDRLSQLEDAPGQNEVDEINSRLSDLEANFTTLSQALYDSIPIAFSSGNDNDDDGDESPFVSAA